MQGQHPEEPQQESPSAAPEREFRIWRLLGAIGVVILLLAAAAVWVDALVLGW